MSQRIKFLHNLPQDLMEEVIAWIPAEILIKFRCVSKSWRALIDSTRFRHLHLRRIMSLSRTSTVDDHRNKFLFRSFRGSEMEDRYYVAEFDSRDKMLKKTILELRLHAPFASDFKRVTFYGSCFGLLCLGYHQQSSLRENPAVILWNPYINKYWKLPSYPPPGSASNCVYSYGFGYDDIADDFKVVRTFHLYDGNGADDEDPLEPEIPRLPIVTEFIVYSLKSNSWTSLPQFPHSNLNRFARGILVNFALHWKLPDNLGRCDVGILALDLRTHEFHRIPLPLEIEGKGRRNFQALDGCLCLLPEYGICQEPSMDVWIMKDYGVKDSWTKLTIQLLSYEFTIPFKHSPETAKIFLDGTPLAHTRSTELFFYRRNGVMWYDTEKKNWILASRQRGRCGQIRQGFQFIGSLIEPCPCGGSATSTRNVGIERVEANLFQLAENAEAFNFISI